MSSVTDGAETRPLRNTVEPSQSVINQYGTGAVSFLAHNPQDFVFKEPNIVNRPQEVYNSANGMVNVTNPMPLNIDPLYQMEQIPKAKNPLSGF